jgi:hypothetical protein
MRRNGVGVVPLLQCRRPFVVSEELLSRFPREWDLHEAEDWGGPLLHMVALKLRRAVSWNGEMMEGRITRLSSHYKAVGGGNLKCNDILRLRGAVGEMKTGNPKNSILKLHWELLNQHNVVVYQEEETVAIDGTILPSKL